MRIKIVRHTTLFDFVDAVAQSQASSSSSSPSPLCSLSLFALRSARSVRLVLLWGLRSAGLSLQSTLAVKP